VEVLQMFDTYSSSGGTATVYIRYAADHISNKKGDLVAVFTKCNFSLIFENDGKEITRNKYLASNFQLNLKKVIVDPRSFSESIYNLLAHKSDTDNIDIPNVEKIMTDSQGVAILNYTPSGDIKIFKNKEQIENFTINNDVQISNLDPDAEYIIDYTYNVNTVSSFDIKEKTLPYFNIEIVNSVSMENNSNKKMYLNINRAALSLNPTLNYAQNEATRTTLEFNIINAEAKAVFY